MTEELSRTLCNRLYWRMQVEPLRYWCYSCEHHFEKNTPTAKCVLCESDVIELAPQVSDPAGFEIYQIQEQPSNSLPNPTQQPVNANSNPMLAPPFVAPIFNITQFMVPLPPQGNGQPFQMNIDVGAMFNQINGLINSGGIQQMLNSLMGQNNLVPASPQEIGRLQQVDKVPECPICQEEDSGSGQKKGYRLQCGHVFHIDCLTPWLQRTNTCPSCRQRL
jgi:hypothetical protein